MALETLTGIKRAGADMILTYHALDAARWLKQRQVIITGSANVGPWMEQDTLGISFGGGDEALRARDKLELVL